MHSSGRRRAEPSLEARFRRPPLARKSKEMAPNSKDLRVGLAYITATCRGSNHRHLAYLGRGAGREGRDWRVPLVPPTLEMVTDD